MQRKDSELQRKDAQGVVGACLMASGGGEAGRSRRSEEAPRQPACETVEKENE